MPSLAEHKNDVVRKLLDIQKEETLKKVEAILDEEIVATTASGEPLTREAYIMYIQSISNSVNEGARTYTTKEVKDSILGKSK